MADINLLSTDNTHKFHFTQGAGLVVKVLIGVLVLIILYYGYLRWEINHTKSTTSALEAKTVKLTAEAMGRKDRDEIVTRQGQLQSLDGLIKNHVYWSDFLPELARVSLSSSTYASFLADATGVLDVTVVVPTYADADKYVQVFDLPQFNTQFSDLRILSMSKVQEVNLVATQLKLELKFNPNFIHKTLK